MYFPTFIRTNLNRTYYITHIRITIPKKGKRRKEKTEYYSLTSKINENGIIIKKKRKKKISPTKKYS